MSRVRQVKTNFTAGEINRTLLGRGDLRAYENGALTLRNVFIQPTGGVTRRAGLYYIADAVGPGRLIPFEFNTEQDYLLVLSAGRIDVLKDGLHVATLSAPWTYEQITQLTWTQSADTLLICHPDVAPRLITRFSDSNWLITHWTYHYEGGLSHQPMYRYADGGITLTPTDVSGTVTLVASSGVFNANHWGTRLKLNGETQFLINNVASPTVIEGQIYGADLPDTEAISGWEEQAFSEARGWPICAAFHQDRLVIGGAKALPNRLWFSRSADLWNFDLGTGLDNEAIEFAILSDQVNAIRAVFSGRHLQVFTSGAEWMVSGDPLTPATVQVLRQTRIGSLTSRAVAPVNVDGATLFVSRNGRELREFVYTDLEQAYRAADLALLVRHMFDGPTDMCFDPERRLLCAVLPDGRLAALTLYRAEEIAAWSLHTTEGGFHACAVVGDACYVLVERNGAWTIESFDDDLCTDCALTGTSAVPTVTWSGLSHLNGRTVTVVADGGQRPDAVISGGTLTLDTAASTIEVGLPYTHIIEPMPPSSVSTQGAGRATRLVEVTFRLQDTKALSVDTGRGLKDVSLRKLTGDTQLDEPPPSVSGDISVPSYGWRSDGSLSPWRIEQAAPLPFTLLSVTLEMKVND